MSETALVIVKFLIGKSVGQFMLTVALFFLIIIFIPRDITELIEARSDLPYAVQIFSFAVAYLIVLILKVTGYFFVSALPLCQRRGRAKRMLKTLNSLSTEQLFLLEPFLKTHSPTFRASWDNPDADALVNAGIVRPAGSCIDGVSVMFKIEPEYESLMLSTWNPCTKRFDISR
ncbi:hypothetical protein IF554_004097 [Salmonella enterica]|nr:hypothetical protein [Salmonella enterica]EGU2084438.1 hypothetical protein [Salmonella enterica]